MTTTFSSPLAPSTRASLGVAALVLTLGAVCVAAEASQPGPNEILGAASVAAVPQATGAPARCGCALFW